MNIHKYTKLEQQTSLWTIVNLYRYLTDYTGIKISGHKKWGSEATKSGDEANRTLIRTCLIRANHNALTKEQALFASRIFFSLTLLIDQTLRSLPRFSSILFNRAAIKLPVSSHEIRKNRTDLVIAHLLISRDKSFALVFLFVCYIYFV